MITNKQNLPQIFIDYLDKPLKPLDPKRYSVTELLNSSREIILSRKYRDIIEEDAVDKVSAMIGTMIHECLERMVDNGEVKVEAEINSYTVAGIIDRLEDDEIVDYKKCSVSKIQKQDYNDWFNQGLIYAYLLLLSKDVVIRKFTVNAILSDWSKIKAVNNPTYPQKPIITLTWNFQDSDFDYIAKYLKNKLNEINSDIIPECSLEDKWYTGDKYAVYKKVGDKRASKVFDDEQEAHNYITNELGGAGQIEIRKGEELKCNYYCKVRRFCK